MKNLYEPAIAEEVKQRLILLTPDNQPQWGKMNATQMVEHCSRGVEMATGDSKLPQVFIGRILGPLIRSKALDNDDPMRRNSPTAPALIVHDEGDFEIRQQRLTGLIEKFVAAGPQGCTMHPHPFFGQLTPTRWATLMYKHLDHHFRQFGV